MTVAGTTELKFEWGMCAARWATTGTQHVKGDLCGAPATEQVSDVELCGYHYRRALDWFYKRQAELPEKWEVQRRETARLVREGRSVVYYLHSQSSGLIKIGFSSDYRRRLVKLKGEHGPLRLLLATAGGRKEEDEAHKAFAEHWVHGEWFRPEKPLLLYIQRARKAAAGTKTRLPEQVPIEEIRALIRAAQAQERAARSA